MSELRRHRGWGARVRLPAAAVAVLALLVTGCGGGGGSGEKKQLTIALQPGLAYAPLLVMKNEGTLEKALPNYKVSWKVLSSGSAIRDGMISDDIQVGAPGLSPFLVGWNEGVDWKILSALSNMDLWLMAKEKRLRSLKDFQGSDKIAMPAPDSMQSIVLRKGAQQQLGDAKALDKNIVALDHPSALQALMSGQVAGHLTSPPYQFIEKQKGAHVMLRSSDLLGEHNFNLLVVREGFHNDNSEAMKTLFEQTQKAMDTIKNDPDRAAKILAAESDDKPAAKQWKSFLQEEGVRFTTTPKGLMKFAQFMKKVGFVEEPPGSWRDLVFDNLKGLQGS
ncbi:MAG: hypothetical protein GEU78_07725 [Actinobacteria bacterium]|nr:hypothetical protein [Actinomycetota bacterium]MQB00167.1 hypothetical protein [Actinomycetota bacterium]